MLAGIKIQHSMSETAREGLNLLKSGATALKHGRKGKPHQRHVRVAQSLRWDPVAAVRSPRAGPGPLA